MKTNFDFLADFAMQDFPTLLPQEEAYWLLRDTATIPTAWTVQAENVQEAEWQRFAEVLFQKETKKLQMVFLENLKKPEKTITLEMSETAEEILPILIKRPAAAQALSLKIKVPANAKAKLVFLEQLTPATAPGEVVNGMPNVSLAFELGEYAKVESVYIHPLYTKDSEATYLRAADKKVCMYLADLARGAAFKWTSVNLGDSLLEKGAAYLNGEEAAANIGGAAFVQDGSDQTYQSHVYCRKPYASSKIHNHAVVENGGNGSLVSISDITKGAHGTVVREDNRFMTLGEKAKAFVDPTLLIDEYDVKASHAATVGQVDEEALYYLQSRGLSRQQASRLMTAGFLTPLFDRISYQPLRERMLAVFYEKMHLDMVLMEGENE